LSNPLHVLLVEASADQLQLVGDFIGRHGTHVTRCADGQGALAAAGQNGSGFDLVITDLGGMPEPLRYLQQLRTATPRAMCVLATNLGELDQAMTEGVRYLGIARFITKPVDLGDLQELVDGLARSREHDRVSQQLSRTTQSLGSGRHARADQTPFFGTGRLENSGSQTRLTPVPNQPSDPTPFFGTSKMEGSGSQSSLSPIRPSQAQLQGGDVPLAPHRGTTTRRFRRSVTGRIDRQDPKQSAPGPAQQAPQQQQLQVTCPACQRNFAALPRPQGYTIPCIHCGQMTQVPAQGG